MGKKSRKTAKWFSVLADLHGPVNHQVSLYELEPPAVQVYFYAIGYVCKQGIDYVPRAVPRLAIGGRGLKRAVAQLVEHGFLIPDGGPLGSYGIAHEGVLWRRGRAPESRNSIPDAIKFQVFERDGFACVLCGSPDWLSLDHIFPWSLGGTDEPENLRVLCRSCNSRKGARLNGS